MKSRLGQYCINVSDIDHSEKFYVDICGLNVEQRMDIPEIRVKELVLGAHDNAGGQIQLAEHYDTKGEPIDHGNAFWKLYVYTDDCKGLYDAAIAFGCESVTEPHDLDGWPVTCAFVLDPDGYNVEILQRHSES